MKIKGTCHSCRREFLGEQVVAAYGHCPWCGVAFQRDYTPNLIRALREAEAAAKILRKALEEILEIDPAFDLDGESVLSPLREALDRSRGRAIA